MLTLTAAGGDYPELAADILDEIMAQTGVVPGDTLSRRRRRRRLEAVYLYGGT